MSSSTIHNAELTTAEVVSKVSAEETVISAGKGDRVRIAQASSYLALLTKKDLLSAYDTDLLIRVCTEGAHVLPKQDRDKLMKAMSKLPKSHQWVKGLCATYLITLYLNGKLS